MAISGLSLIRAYRRYQQIPAQSVIGEYLDEHYPDEYLAHRYQNMSQNKVLGKMLTPKTLFF